MNDETVDNGVRVGPGWVMSTLWIIGFRRALGVFLIIVLALTGIGTAAATMVRQVDAPDAIPGVHIPICHADRGEVPSDPASPERHDCCDACALLAPLVLPAPPVSTGSPPFGRFVEHVRVVALGPALARPHGPKQSQGPPAA